MINEPLTATEVEERWEAFKKSPEVKAAEKELHESLFAPIIIPMVEQLFKILVRDKKI